MSWTTLQRAARRLWFGLAALCLVLHERSSVPLRGRRGAAMIVVLGTITILGVSVVEFIYNTRVNLHLAQNQRDATKAYFLARSGIELQRLVLPYQFELQQSQGALIGRAIQNSNFQLWRYASLLLPTFATGRLDTPIGSLDLEDTGATGFGGLHGTVEIPEPEPEEGKINLNEFSGRSLDMDMLVQFCSLIAPPQYDDAFDDNDNNLRARYEVIAAIIDHVDPDSDQTILDENCQPRPGGRGNESIRYRELDWEAKNEPLITVDEVRLVPGVTDRFMDEFGETLTVYPVPRQFFPNLAGAPQFMGFLCENIVGVDEEFNACALPAINYQISWLALGLEGWVQFFDNPFNVLGVYLGLSGGEAQRNIADGIAAGQMIAFRRKRDFINVVDLFRNNPELLVQFSLYARPELAQRLVAARNLGVEVVPPSFGVQFDQASMAQRISIDTPQIYTVRATGRYGTASRTIETVIDLRGDKNRLLYWREF